MGRFQPLTIITVFPKDPCHYPDLDDAFPVGFQTKIPHEFLSSFIVAVFQVLHNLPDIAVLSYKLLFDILFTLTSL
jgi:hypothetical protein